MLSVECDNHMMSKAPPKDWKGFNIPKVRDKLKNDKVIKDIILEKNA